MSKPNKQQRAQAVAEHIQAVGKFNVSAYEVALTLDEPTPGHDRYGICPVGG